MIRQILFVAFVGVLFLVQNSACAQRARTDQEQRGDRILRIVRGDDANQKAQTIRLLARIGAVGAHKSRQLAAQ